MARILLINPPSPERLGGPLVGLQYVASSLLARGFEVRVIDAAGRAFSPEPGWILSEAESFSPDVVGFALYTRWVRLAYQIVELFRGRFPLLIAGGPHATACPEEVLRFGFDVAVVGEAEQALTAVLDRVKGTGGKDIRGGALAARVQNLDSVAFPHRSRHLFNPGWYGMTEWPAISDGIVSSRGCPARCTFCANHVTGREFRFRSVENVLREIAESHSLTGATFFPFWDDAINADPERLIGLCGAMERDLSFSVRWSATARVTEAQPPLLAAMKRAGCLQITFGVESGDDQTLRRIRKGIRKRNVTRALEAAKEAGLRTACNFMFGFPEESVAAIERTLRFMEEIAPLVDCFSPAGVLIPMPATPVYEASHEHYGFTEWWLKEEYSRPPDSVPTASFGDFCRSSAADPTLDLDFFHYSEETRAAIRACLEFKTSHNLRRIGQEGFPHREACS
jgi:anaerobic magnesium-protoporphyrin IX monomethyl ester cyclase